MLIVVCGLHMRGEPLASELEAAGGTYVRDAVTVPHYTLHALLLPGAITPMPGLLYHPPGDHDHATAAIAVEVWELPNAAVGEFLGGVPPPLALGSVRLDASVSGGGRAGGASQGLCVRRVGAGGGGPRRGGGDRHHPFWRVARVHGIAGRVGRLGWRRGRE